MAANKAPAFQFYASDWLGSTKRAMMTPAQRGAYIDLLCYQWGDETCSLPDDDKILATLSGLGEGWLKGGSSALQPCFPKHPTIPGRVANPRLLEVKKARDEWVERSRQGGVKSGETRRQQAEGQSKGTSENGEGHLNTPSSSPSPSSSSRPAPKKKPTPPDGGAFGLFWDAVPNKVGKGAARKAYKQAIKRMSALGSPEDARAHLLDRMTAFAATPKAKGQYCPHPATWLNQDRYDDDPAMWQEQSGEPRDVMADIRARRDALASVYVTARPGAGHDQKG